MSNVFIIALSVASLIGYLLLRIEINHRRHQNKYKEIVNLKWHEVKEVNNDNR